MTEPVPTDAELMTDIAAGHMEALGELVKRYQQDMLSLALRVMGSPDKAPDIVQEAFLRVHRSAKRYRPEARFTTWMYRIVVNLCMDEMRKTRPVLELTHDPPQETKPDRLEQEERVLQVRQAIADLPERQRVVLILSRYNNLSHMQIAETTGWTDSAVESLLVRAYRSLREKLINLQKY